MVVDVNAVAACHGSHRCRRMRGEQACRRGSYRDVRVPRTERLLPNIMPVVLQMRKFRSNYL